MTSASPDTILLAWYDRNHRHLPWRSPPGMYADPYHVWLSEIMLQQTTVAAVRPYYLTFLSRWPTVEALAAADDADVMAAWAGLGYYARARNLLSCARIIVRDHGGHFPGTEQALLMLPGIGAYTAAAIASIAFGQRAVVVDGNVERVMARLHAVTDPLPGAKKHLRTLADALTPQQRCGDYAQAVMDLGATLCSPRSPNCQICPWVSLCKGYHQGIAAELPYKTAKAKRPGRYGTVFWITEPKGAVLLRQRPPKGLLGGMTEIPSTPWQETPWTLEDATSHAPIQGETWHTIAGTVHHTFSHFDLELKVIAGTVAKTGNIAGHWVKPEHFDQEALPSVMRKVIRHMQKQDTG